MARPVASRPEELSNLFLSARFSDAIMMTKDGDALNIHKSIVFTQAPCVAEDFGERTTCNVPFSTSATKALLQYLYTGSYSVDDNDPQLPAVGSLALPVRGPQAGGPQAAEPQAEGSWARNSQDSKRPGIPVEYLATRPLKRLKQEVVSTTKARKNGVAVAPYVRYLRPRGQKGGMINTTGDNHPARRADLLRALTRHAEIHCAANWYELGDLQGMALATLDGQLRLRWDRDVFYDLLDVKCNHSTSNMRFIEIPPLVELASSVAAEHIDDILKVEDFSWRYLSGPFCAVLVQQLAKKLNAPSASVEPLNEEIKALKARVSAESRQALNQKLEEIKTLQTAVSHKKKAIKEAQDFRTMLTTVVEVYNRRGKFCDICPAGTALKDWVPENGLACARCSSKVA